MVRLAVLSIIAAIGLSACGGGEATVVAKAALKDSAGIDIGTIMFTELVGQPLKLSVAIATQSSSVAPGEHALHLHAGKTCVPPTFMSAGDHWNPGMMVHGLPGPLAHHAGDLGNVTVNPDKTGAYELTTTEITLLPGDINKYVVGRTIIIHANKDDGITQMPYGNSGARIGCGVIGPP